MFLFRAVDLSPSSVLTQPRIAKYWQEEEPWHHYLGTISRAHVEEPFPNNYFQLYYQTPIIWKPYVWILRTLIPLSNFLIILLFPEHKTTTNHA